MLINYTAPPTVAQYMRSEAFARFILGPVGSSKTTGTIFELLRRAIEQAQAPDGLRYTRFAIVRQTLKQLKDTVLKDIEQWLSVLCHYKVSDNTVYVEFGDVRSEWLLIPLDDPQDVRRLLSMQLTGAWCSEVIEMSHEIIPALAGRCGRYPSAMQGGATWRGIVADTNFPTEGSDWHRLFELETPPDWQIFKQPGGLTPEAENLEWLDQTPETLKLDPMHPVRQARGRGYYERLSRGHSPAWVQRYVHAQYGEDPSGSAVFKTTFKRSFHVVPELTPAFGHPIIVTQDFGRNPCSLISQVDHRGRALVLEEVVSEDMGLELHLKTRLLPALMQERYQNRPMYVIGDPAGRQRSSTYEETSFDVLKKHGLRAFPAPTNDIKRRIAAVDALLLQQRDGGPALMIDEGRCPFLINGLSGMYRYAKRRNGQLNNLPDKTHPWSDLADDLQYFCLVVHGGMGEYIANRVVRRPAVQHAAPFSAAAWT